MTNSVAPALSLEQAKALVSHLESGEVEQANQMISDVAIKANMSSDLFAEVGKLTRQLHDSLQDFNLDPRINNLAKQDIPDARQRLSYVIEKTEDAANRTMDALDASMPIADTLHQQLSELNPSWQKLMTRQINPGEFKQLCHSMNGFIKTANGDAEKLRGLLTEILMAQDFQDLTGQVIRRVIVLVQEVEESLIHMLKVFGAQQALELEGATEAASAESQQEEAIKAEGPIVDKEREDVVSDQDDVDDLLSSLGF